jgi:hypothetical protein
LEEEVLWEHATEECICPGDFLFFFLLDGHQVISNFVLLRLLATMMFTSPSMPIAMKQVNHGLEHLNHESK